MHTQGAARMAPVRTSPAWCRHSRGCEAAIHSARRYLQTLAPDHVMVKLDFANAFNSLHRSDMLMSVRDCLYAFCLSSYCDRLFLTRLWCDRLKRLCLWLSYLCSLGVCSRRRYSRFSGRTLRVRDVGCARVVRLCVIRTNRDRLQCWRCITYQ